MSNIWKIAIGAVVVVVLAGAATGFALAQSDEEGGRLSNFISRLAANLGVTEEEFEAAVDKTQIEIVDEKLADGTITEEQAADLQEKIESGEGFSFGKFGHGRGFGNGFGLHGGGEALADFLGITVEELQEARQGEQSLAQIAEANGTSRDDLIAFLVGQVEEQLATKVEEGKIDQARADEMLARFEENVDELVDSTGQKRQHRDGSGGFHGRFAPEHETTDLTSA